MKHWMTSAALCVVAGTLLASAPAFAAPKWQDHSDWNKGGHMAHTDWDRGQHLDYRQYHLRKPPHGYEWRNVDGKYVLAAVATGVIADIVLNGH